MPGVANSPPNGSSEARMIAVVGRGAEGVRAIRRRAVEDAVIAVITRKGVEALTVQDVADELGVAKGTLYLYFTSRDEMILATARTVRRDLARELAPLFQHGSLEECLTKLILRVSQLSEGQRRLLNAIPGEQPSERSRDEWGWKWSREQLLRLFARARRRHEIDDVPSGALATFLADYLGGLISRRDDASPRCIRAAVATALVSVLLDGIRATHTSAPSPAKPTKLRGSTQDSERSRPGSNALAVRGKRARRQRAPSPDDRAVVDAVITIDHDGVVKPVAERLVNKRNPSE